MKSRDDRDSDFDELEFPDPDDMDPDDGDEFAETEPCPRCGKELFEQAEVCPHCGAYRSQEQIRNRRPIWIIVVVILCVLAMLIFWL